MQGSCRKTQHEMCVVEQMSETAVVWMAAFSQMLQKEESWSLKFEVFKHCGIFFTFLTRQSESAVFSWVVTTLSNPKVFVKYCSFSRECVAINASQPGLPPRRRPSLGRWLSYSLTLLQSPARNRAAWATLDVFTSMELWRNDKWLARSSVQFV